MSNGAPDPRSLVFGAAGLEDPYSIYATLREEAPVHTIGPMRFVTRYDDVTRCARDHEQFSSDVMAAAAGEGTRMIPEREARRVPPLVGRSTVGHGRDAVRRRRREDGPVLLGDRRRAAAGSRTT